MKTDKDDNLLPEDILLLKEFAEIGDLSSGAPLEDAKRKMLVIQTRAILRSRKTMIDLDKSNKRFSFVVGSFALLQLAVAVFQVGFDMATTTNKVIGFIGAIVFFVFINQWSE